MSGKFLNSGKNVISKSFTQNKQNYGTEVWKIVIRDLVLKGFLTF